MQGVFKSGNKLIVNCADSDERILINDFYDECLKSTNKINVEKVLDINGDADGLIFSIVNTILPDIAVFPVDNVELTVDSPLELDIQTNPKDGINIFSVSDDYVKVETVAGSTEVTLTGLKEGSSIIHLIISKDGYNDCVLEIKATIKSE